MRYYRRILTVGAVVVTLVLLNTAPVSRQRFTVTTEANRIGLLEYVPPGYYENSEKYPLVIFLHGIVERGIDATDRDVIRSQIHWVDNLGPPAWVRMGHDFPFIMVSPQLKSNQDYWPAEHVDEVLNWARETLRVDEKRIHITGLSLGGGAVFAAVQDHPDIYASGVPVCAYWNSPARAAAIARENVAIWAFHGADDPQVPLHTNSYMIDSINNSNPPPDPKARLSVYTDSKHDIWNTVYTPADHEHASDVYQWMMRQFKTKRGNNIIPTAQAGPDQVLKDAGMIVLSGSGSDPDGKIVSYRWTQFSGPPLSLGQGSSKDLSIRISRKGIYVFKLTVADNAGDTDTDYVRVVAE